MRSPGRALDAGTRAFMEPRFGTDFGHVRVHTDAESARSIDAVAYTVGQDIVFDRGRYEPGTAQGRRLLAHELAHVVQQANGPLAVQRYAGCTRAQGHFVRVALNRARRRTRRVIDIMRRMLRGENPPRAAATLRHFFGSIDRRQTVFALDRILAAYAHLRNPAAWRCDSGDTFVYCGPDKDWFAGTDCPGGTVSHLCPALFQHESHIRSPEPSRAMIMIHEALRAAGACTPFDPPGIRTPPASLDNVYAYTRFMFSIAGAGPE